MSFLQRIGLRPRPIQLEDDDYDYKIHQYRVRFSIVGPVGSGKTTLAAALILTAETMSAQIKNFYCKTLPKSSDIMIHKNNLRAGRFPPKTDPFLPVAPEAGLIVGESSRGIMGKGKVLQIPICDVGGEVYDVLGTRRPSTSQFNRIRNINRAVVNHIRDSQGFIITLPAPDAQMFRQDWQARDTDSYIYHVLSRVMDHKKFYKQKIEAAAVWITQWDKAVEQAREEYNMDIYRDERPQLLHTSTSRRRITRHLG
jgi:GTPase SAR1 family protein